MNDIEARVRALEAQVRGECPECGRKVKGWSAPFGCFAPEMWATLREQGIDPATGHRQTCAAARRSSR